LYYFSKPRQTAIKRSWLGMYACLQYGDQNREDRHSYPAPLFRTRVADLKVISTSWRAHFLWLRLLVNARYAALLFGAAAYTAQPWPGNPSSGCRSSQVHEVRRPQLSAPGISIPISLQHNDDSSQWTGSLRLPASSHPINSCVGSEPACSWWSNIVYNDRPHRSR